MDHETNKQEPSGTEIGQVNYRVGDKVWVRAKVAHNSDSSEYMELDHNGYEIIAHKSDCRPVEPVNNPEIPDSSSDPLAPSPCMDGVNVDDFVDGIMEEKWKAHGFKVGNTVRYICPGHSRHGTECAIHSISNAGIFFVLADEFHTYCSIAEIQHLSVAFVSLENSMQLLAGTDTIQAGDLQWTDWDKKYRMCNFTIGMRVDQAIQRGKDNGQKWLFYRRIGGGA